MARVTSTARRLGRSQAGYTLFETLVVLAILLIVVGAIADGFVSASHAEVDQTARASDQQNARQALERMRRDIHCANAASIVKTTDAGGNVTASKLLLSVNPGQCLGVTSGTDGVEWCTASVGGSTTRYALYRTVVTSCDAADAVFQVDYLTSPDIWAKACSADLLAGITVTMPVNRDPVARPGRTYTASDTISLRNASVSSSTSVCS
jgi:prepilin-type N-terminal cleavage/methylation domain-containing protein